VKRVGGGRNVVDGALLRQVAGFHERQASGRGGRHRSSTRLRRWKLTAAATEGDVRSLPAQRFELT
jgi:hypothetical protein